MKKHDTIARIAREYLGIHDMGGAKTLAIPPLLLRAALEAAYEAGQNPVTDTMAIARAIAMAPSRKG